MRSSVVPHTPTWCAMTPSIAAVFFSCSPEMPSPSDPGADTRSVAASDAADARADVPPDLVESGAAGDAATGGSAAEVCSLEAEAPEDSDARGGDDATPIAASPAFDDVTAELGIPPMYAQAFSWGLIDDDDLPDLFIPHAWAASDGERGTRVLRSSESVEAHIVLSCPRGPWRTFPLGWRALGLRSQMSALVFDVTGDGAADLVHTNGQDVLVAARTPDAAFSAPTELWSPSAYFGGRVGHAAVASVTPSDLDRDGHVDLMLSRLYWGPPTDATVDPRRANALLRGRAAGFEDVTPIADGWIQPEIRETFTIGTAPSWDTRSWLLYVAGHSSTARIMSTRDGLRFAAIGGAIPYGSSMGVDVTYDTERDRMLWVVSQSFSWPMIELGREGIWTDVSTRVRGPAIRDTWGVLFADFDNDGWEDLAYATSIEPRHLVLLRNEPDVDGTRVWVDRSSAAGPLFDGTRLSDDYALLSADFDRDGCVDLGVGPIPIEIAAGEFEYDAPIRLARNRCRYAGRFIGWRVDDQPGTLYRLTLREPDATLRTQVRSVKAASSIGGRSDMSVIHFGLGDASPTQLEVQCLYGDAHLVEVSPEGVGAYGDIRGLCLTHP